MSYPSRIYYDPNPQVFSRAIMGPSAGRVQLTFFPPSTGRVTLANSPVSADGAGLVLIAGQPPITLDSDEIGDILQQGWYALYSAGATGVSWIETLL